MHAESSCACRDLAAALHRSHNSREANITHSQLLLYRDPRIIYLYQIEIWPRFSRRAAACALSASVSCMLQCEHMTFPRLKWMPSRGVRVHLRLARLILASCISRWTCVHPEHRTSRRLPCGGGSPATVAAASSSRRIARAICFAGKCSVSRGCQLLQSSHCKTAITANADRRTSRCPNTQPRSQVSC